MKQLKQVNLSGFTVTGTNSPMMAARAIRKLFRLNPSGLKLA